MLWIFERFWRVEMLPLISFARVESFYLNGKDEKETEKSKDYRPVGFF